MRMIQRIATVGLILALAPGLLLAAPTAEEVAAKNVEARGGKAAWDAVETLRLTGSFQAFSKTKPFTLHRKGRKYHMDHHLGDKPVVMGFDGENAWWDNAWMQPGPQGISGVDRTVFERELDTPNPFFDHVERGHKLKLVGEAEVEGQMLIQVDITRSDESKETWYLDPDTHLEVFRDSPGSDFGRPMTQRTFFDDFREVDGVMIPHYTETQWYTRYRVMEVAEVAINAPVGDRLFGKPVPPGMENFVHLGGIWAVEMQQRQQPQAPWDSSERTSTIELKLGDTLLEERFTTATGTEVIRTLSFDRFRKRYRLTNIDARTGLMDVQEGTADEQGKLVVSNVETGTPFEGFGMVFHQRSSFWGESPDAFQMEAETSIDGGESWFVSAKATYTRQTE